MTTDIPHENKASTPRFPRIFAFIIDCIIVGVACLLISKVLYPFFKNTPFIFQCIGTFICLFYFATFNSNINNGKTIGKMICKIRVKDFAGTSIPLTHSLFRSSYFIIPICFVGYLQAFSNHHLSLSLIVALFQSIIFACLYLVLFNKNTQQSFHDILSKTQILRNSQSNLPYQTVWKPHYYIIVGLSIVILSTNLWLYDQTKTISNNLSQISKDIKSIQINTHHTVAGETETVDQILILNVDNPRYLNQLDMAETLIGNIQKKHAELFTEYKINKIRFNFAYQFGLAKISKSTVYDYNSTQNLAKLTQSGEISSTTFGF